MEGLAKMIPEQLRDAGFVLLKGQSKIPYEKGWQSNFKTYEHADAHLQLGLNYGVVCEQDDIRVLDTDNPELTEYALESLPKTFSVKTGGGGVHFYYKIKHMTSKVILQKGDIHYGEIQGPKTQVVGPHSIHPNGNKYKILRDLPITEITLEDIKFSLKDFYDIKENKVYEKEKETFDLMSVVDTSGLTKNGNELQGSHPVHGSTGGMNFTVNASKGLWHCFRHNTGGDAWYWLAVKEGVLDCGDCTHGMLRGDKFIEVKKKAIQQGLIKDDYKNKLTQNIIEAFGDMTIPNKVSEFLKVQPIHYDEAKNWWIWQHQKCTWKMLDETNLLVSVKKVSGFYQYQSKWKNEFLELLKQQSREQQPKQIPVEWIQFGTHFHNIETGEKTQATHEYFTINSVPHEVAITENTPIIDKIFTEWVGEEYVLLLKQVIAYCTYRAFPIQRIFWLVGEGSNGKSKYQDFLTNFIGIENVSTSDASSLFDPKNRFETTKLYKKLACTIGETEYKELTRTSTYKKLTGGDRISYEWKGKTAIDDYNYAKIIANANELPITQDNSKGFHRRNLIIQFPNEFTEKTDPLKQITKEEYENFARQTLTILKILLNDKTFYNEGSIEDRAKKWNDLSNPFKKFLTEETQTSEEFIYRFEFEERFLSWLKTNGYSTSKWGKVLIKKEMEKTGHDLIRETSPSEGSINKRYFYDAIKWKTSFKEDKAQKALKAQPLGTNSYIEKLGQSSGALGAFRAVPSIKDDFFYWLKGSSGNEGVEIELIIKEFFNGDREKGDKLIEQWKTEGLLFESKPGSIKVLE